MKIEWSGATLADLDRFAEFLHQHFPRLAPRIAKAIIDKSEVLLEHPRLGRRIGGRDEYREVALKVAKAVYFFRYRIDGERIVMLRVIHWRERR